MYGLLICTGIFLSALVVEYFLKKEGENTDILWELIVVTVFFGVLGARIYHVLDYFTYYLTNPSEIFKIWHGGLGIFGGLVFGTLASFVFLKLRKVSIEKWLNALTLGIPLAQAIGRWGNFFNDEIAGTWLIPLYALESLLNFILFGVLVAIYKRNKIKTFATYLSGYGAIRFSLEFLRERSWAFMGIRVAQIFAILFMLVGIFLLINSPSKDKKKGYFPEA